MFEDEGGDDGTAGDEEDGGEHHQVMMKVVIVSKCVLKSRSSLVQDAAPTLSVYSARTDAHSSFPVQRRLKRITRRPFLPNIRPWDRNHLSILL